MTDYGEHSPPPLKPPSKATVRRLHAAWRELDALLHDDAVLVALVEQLGLARVEAIIDAHESMRELVVPTVRRGRNPTSPVLLAHGRALIASYLGDVTVYFKRSPGGSLRPGNKFTKWFCDEMRPTTTAKCRTILRKLRRR